MVGLVEAVYKCIGWISDPSDHRFNPDFHRSLQQVSYAAARHDDFKEPEEKYWDAAKAYVALELTTDKNVPMHRRLSAGFFSPPKEGLPLYQGDAETIAKGLKFKGCNYGYNTSPYIPDAAKKTIDEYIQRLRDNWYGKRSGSEQNVRKKRNNS